MMKADINTEVLPFKMKVSTQRQKCAVPQSKYDVVIDLDYWLVA